MKVAAVVVVYRGCLDSVQVFRGPFLARKRYKEILKEHSLTEDELSSSDYDITLETDLLVY